MILNKREVGQRLAEFRKSLSLKQEAFANAIGISRAVLSQIEVGRTELSIELLATIRINFWVDYDWLIFGKSIAKANINEEDWVSEPKEEHLEKRSLDKNLLIAVQNLQNEIKVLKNRIEKIEKSRPKSGNKISKDSKK